MEEIFVQKKTWIITLLTAGFVVFLFLGITSARAAESVQISDILNDPVIYEGSVVEITGTIVAIDHGLLIEDGSEAQILVSAGPIWYLESPDGAGLDLEVGDVITVVGTVCTTAGPQGQSRIHLAAFEIDGVPLRDGMEVRPPWVGGQSLQNQGQSQNRRQSRIRSDVAAGFCGGGSLAGLAYGFRRF